MAVQRIKVSLSIGFAGAVHKNIIDVEIPEDATEKEVEEIKEEAAKEWAFNYIDIGWSDL